LKIVQKKKEKNNLINKDLH